MILVQFRSDPMKMTGNNKSLGADADERGSGKGLIKNASSELLRLILVFAQIRVHPRRSRLKKATVLESDLDLDEETRKQCHIQKS